MAGNCMKIRKKSFFPFIVLKNSSQTGITFLFVYIAISCFLTLNQVTEKLVIFIDFREINIEVFHVGYQRIIVAPILKFDAY